MARDLPASAWLEKGDQVPGIWQKTMIALARSDRLRRWVQRPERLRALASRFIAGGDLAALLERVARLEREGFLASVYYLGEYVESPALVEANVEGLLETMAAFAQSGTRSFLSVDPTQIGYSISDEFGLKNARRLRTAFPGPASLRFLMIDMEDASYVERSLALHDRLKAEGLPVAVTLQAYLRRTEGDLARLGGKGAAIRLCKGAFVAGEAIAWTRRREIDAAYLRLGRQLFSPAMKAAGAYPIIATHDERMVAALLPDIRNAGWREGEYEIEMLLGVREDLRRRLRESGHAVRVYVPFGSEWWAYTMRRVGENPANLRRVLRSLLS